jgi:hypothetical protein
MTTSEIVSKYRGDRSLREFAGELSSKMPVPISYETIRNWESGTKPAYYLILAIAMHNDDWRRQMALDILAVMNPEYKPDPLGGCP